MVDERPDRSNRKQGPLVIGLGESLFDCFGDRRVLGGAPLNVAVHANALLSARGGSAMPVTRVGDDRLGTEVIESLVERGIGTEGVQKDPDRPTGRVQVEVDDRGVATYDFERDSAWDAIEYDAAAADLSVKCDAVAYGTLGQRSATSRDSIQRFLADAKGAVRLFDVNLRQDYYSADLLAESLRLATAVKVNEEELQVLRKTLDSQAGAEESLSEAAAILREAFDLSWVAVTRGPDGVAMATSEGWIEGGKPEPLDKLEPNADTVGAGDACCAGLLAGTLLGWPAEKTLALANATGSYVASRAGATPALPESIIDLVVER